MTLPRSKDLTRAWAQVMAAYKKWFLLKTAKDAKACRQNELIVKMQQRAAIVRRRAVLAKVERVRFKANPVTAHIRVPELNGVVGRPARET
jgi:hypothetical protein